MVTEQWIVVCRGDDPDDPFMAAHGPFTDEHRAEVWAKQHELDIRGGHAKKCPLGTLLAWTAAIRLEKLV